MRRRRLIMIVGGCLVVVTLALSLALSSGEREPEYGGKKLSDWLYRAATNANVFAAEEYDRYDDRILAAPKAKEAAEAVRHIGTEGIPFLILWLAYEPPPFKVRAVQLLGKPSFARNHRQRLEAFIFGRFAERADLAVTGFWILGPRAVDAVPQLTGIMRSGRQAPRYRAIVALMSLGEVGFPPLQAALTNRHDPCHSIVGQNLDFVQHLGTNAVIAIPALVSCLEDPDDRIVRQAAEALGKVKIEPAMVVPALTSCLTKTNAFVRFAAVRSLARYGPYARSALPTLLTIVVEEGIVGWEAKKTIRAVAPEVSATNAWNDEFRPRAK